MTGIRSSEMAERLGVHRNTITHWESDAAEPTLHRIRQWANITGVDIGWLLGSVHLRVDPDEVEQLRLDFTAVDVRDCVTVSSPLLVAA